MTHTQCHTDTRLEHPEKSGFSERKRPKEGERVVLGHFHERGGESPQQYEKGASGSKKSLFVHEIQPFEVGIVVQRMEGAIWLECLNFQP